MVTYSLFMVNLRLQHCYGYFFDIHGQLALLLWLLLHYSWSICICVMVTSSIFMVNLHQCYGYLYIIHGQFVLVLWLLFHYSWSIYGCISIMVTYSLFMVNLWLHFQDLRFLLPRYVFTIPEAVELIPLSDSQVSWGYPFHFISKFVTFLFPLAHLWSVIFSIV